MYWLRWHYHVKDIAGAPYKIKKKERKKRKTKQQNRRQSVVAGRQQLYCAVQSRSPRVKQPFTDMVIDSVRLLLRGKPIILMLWRQYLNFIVNML